MSVSPSQVAATWTLPDLRTALATATGWRRALILAAIRIHLGRLWQPYD